MKKLTDCECCATERNCTLVKRPSVFTGEMIEFYMCQYCKSAWTKYIKKLGTDDWQVLYKEYEKKQPSYIKKK